MSDRPLYSVVIPTYHRNNLLACCLERLAPGRQEGLILIPCNAPASTAGAESNGNMLFSNPDETGLQKRPGREHEDEIDSLSMQQVWQTVENRCLQNVGCDVEGGSVGSGNSSAELSALPPSYEVVVTDDGRLQTAQAMLRERFPWAKWTEGPHQGRASNVNHGAGVASGSWIVVTDDDCIPGGSWLSAYHTAQVSGRLFYEGRTTCAEGCKSPMETAPINLHGGVAWGCNVMIQHELFDAVGGYDEKFRRYSYEDIDLARRIKESGQSPLFVPDAVVDHPPRRIAGPKTLAMTNENRYYYAAKFGERVRLSALFKELARLRINAVRNNHWQTDSFRLMANSILEFLIIACLAPYWSRKFKEVSVEKVGHFLKP